MEIQRRCCFSSSIFFSPVSMQVKMFSVETYLRSASSRADFELTGLQGLDGYLLYSDPAACTEHVFLYFLLNTAALAPLWFSSFSFIHVSMQVWKSSVGAVFYQLCLVDANPFRKVALLIHLVWSWVWLRWRHANHSV